MSPQVLAPDSHQQPLVAFGTIARLRLESVDAIISPVDDLLLLSEDLDDVEARWVTAIAEQLAISTRVMLANPELPLMPSIALESATVGAAQKLISAEALRDALFESSSGLEIAAILGVPYVAAEARWRYRSVITDSILDDAPWPRAIPRVGDYRTYRVACARHLAR